MDEVQQRVVDAIRALAAERTLPESHLADRAGVSRSHYFAVMAGTRSPTLGWLTKVAQALGVDIEELVSTRSRHR